LDQSLLSYYGYLFAWFCRCRHTVGAIVIWEDFLLGASTILAQRVDVSGKVTWRKTGDPNLATDGSGGAIVAWCDYRNDPSRNQIYAQHVETSGNFKWTSGGSCVCGLHAYRSDPLAAYDTKGGVILGWADDRNPPSDVFAQRIDNLGNEKWKTDGVSICTAQGLQTSLDITSDGSGCAFLTWLDYRNPNNNNRDIYLQKFDGQSNIQLPVNGEPICTVTGRPTYPLVTPDAGGGVFIVWSDPRNGGSIYTQRLKLVWS
jgi:hypothetical protein